MQFDGDDRGAGSHQLSSDHARAGADVDDEISRANISGLDQPSGPTLIELVPSPAAGVAGHGKPSSSSSSRHFARGGRDAPTLFEMRVALPAGCHRKRTFTASGDRNTVPRIRGFDISGSSRMSGRRSSIASSATRDSTRVRCMPRHM